MCPGALGAERPLRGQPEDPQQAFSGHQHSGSLGEEGWRKLFISLVLGIVLGSPVVTGQKHSVLSQAAGQADGARS